MSVTPRWQFPTTFAAIEERIAAIDPVQYGKTRNFVDGAVTLLSPYISRGVVTLPQLRDIVLARGYQPRHIEKFLQELAWREFFQRVWFTKEEQIFADLKHPQQKVLHHAMPAAIVEANTGIEVIDAQIQQLYTTGYMHNHARMYVAGITCNIAGAYWLQPSRWMYYHLLDGDLGSNTCSWQWVAGSFSSKKYIANQENINRYFHSHQRNTFVDYHYDDIFAQPVPEILNKKLELNLSTPLPAVSTPVIDPTKDVCIYTSYWLNPQWRQGEDVNRILLLEPSHFEKYPVSSKVMAFMMELAQNNIDNLQVFVGNFTELKKKLQPTQKVHFIDHPLHRHFSGFPDPYPWMFPQVKGYYPSFFAFWKKTARYLV